MGSVPNHPAYHKFNPWRMLDDLHRVSCPECSAGLEHGEVKPKAADDAETIQQFADASAELHRRLRRLQTRVLVKRFVKRALGIIGLGAILGFVWPF